MSGCPTHIVQVNARRQLAGIERIERVTRLYLQGKSQAAIAREEGVSVTAVKNSLNKAREWWKETATEQIATQKAKELARIDNIEAEAWRGWERSQRDERSRESGMTPKGPTSKRTRKTQAGSAQFLAIIQKCIDQRVRLLGLDAPEAGDGIQTSLLEVVISTRDEAARILPYSQVQELIEGE